MEITLDTEADAIYIKMRSGKFGHNKKVAKDTILDYDSKGHLLGIEMLGVSKRMSEKELSFVKVKAPLKATA